MTETNFDNLYAKAQPDPVRALLSMPEGTARTQAAYELAVSGVQIDLAIDVWGWGAYRTMLQRKNFGYTWVPAVNQPQLGSVPGITFPGVKPYDPDNPPAGSILVPPLLADPTDTSNDAKIEAMYPPFAG